MAGNQTPSTPVESVDVLALDRLRRERGPEDQRNPALALTDEGGALREQAERIPAGIVERLGMPVEELMNLHSA